jgi:DNA-binding transcriptional LysR family regulator
LVYPMGEKMDLLAAMRIYTRAVECGSLSAAARDLGIGQPSVSERVTQLEKYLGLRLLDRTTRSLQMTDAGNRFYDKARQTLEVADEAVSAIREADAQLRGVLRVAAPHGLGELVLPGLLAEFQRDHPELMIHLTLNDRFVDPVAEGVDLSLRVGRRGEGAFVARALGSMERCLVATPAYLQRYGEPQDPQQLAGHALLRISGLTQDDTLQFSDAAGQTISATIRTGWRCNHWRPLYEAVLADAGIAVLQGPVCAAALREGRLRRVLQTFQLKPLAVHVIYPPGRNQPAKTRLLLKLFERKMPDLLLPDATRIN